MSSTSSRELAASPSGLNEPECEPSRFVKSTRSAGKSSPNIGLASPAMTTLEPLLATACEQMELLPLKSSAAASPARTLALLESRLEWTAPEAAYGQKSPALLANFDPNSFSWKTSQRCLVALANGQEDGLAVFSETWPRSGTMRNGTAFQLQPLVPLTSEIGLGLLPTPRKNDSQKRGSFDIHNLRNGFPAAVKRLFLPTLGKNEPKGSSRKRFRDSEHFRGAKMSEGLRISESDPIYLHPSFAEAVMGFPIGWTELERQATPSSRKSRKSSGGQS